MHTPFNSSRVCQLSAAVVVAVAISNYVIAPQVVRAAVVAGGNVTPATPGAGGNVAAPFLVGDVGVGTLTINGATSLSVTGGSATLGNATAGVGIVNLTGAGSDLTIANDLTIGNAGVGTMGLTNLAKTTLADDLFMGVVAGSSGILTASNLGTIFTITDTASIGVAGTGVVELSNGARVTADDTVLGSSTSGIGRITVSDLQTLWTQTNSLTLGDAGRGTLQVFNSGRVDTTNAVIGNATTGVGTAEISGPGSLWSVTGFVNAGVNGNAIIRVTDGGRINNTTTLRLATTVNGKANIEVSGQDSLWASAGAVTVGEIGFGKISILAGGRMSSSNATLGGTAGARGEVTVDGTGSTWEISGTLDVSNPAEGTLTITNGGYVKSTGLTTIRAAGTVVLDGGRLEMTAATGLNNQGLVSGGGTIVGNVTTTTTGEVRVGVGDALQMKNTLTNAGKQNVDSGELEVVGATTNTGDIDVRNGTLRFHAGVNNNSGGQLSIVGGDVDVFGNITNAVGAKIVVGGSSNATFHDLFTNSGGLLITPGAELLTLQNLSFGSGSSLSLQLADEDPVNGFGRVSTTGTASLSGTLSVALAAGFVPAAGDTFTILNSLAGVSGVFGTETLPALASGLSWDVTYNSNSVVLSIVPNELEGDYNQNGIVDAADYIIYRNTFGQTGSGLAADGNHNNQIDPGDLTVWRSHFGQATTGSGAGLGSAAVPEPGVVPLLLVAISGLVAGRRIRKG